MSHRLQLSPVYINPADEPASLLVLRSKKNYLFHCPLLSTIFTTQSSLHNCKNTLSDPTMKQAYLILTLAAAASAYVGEICGNPTKGYGTCENTAKYCTPKGGTSPSGLCPDDPEDIKCCIYPICYNEEYSNGKCVDKSEYNCQGSYVAYVYIPRERD
jgi:hypothetical protein